jgi:hypothetical protein
MTLHLTSHYSRHSTLWFSRCGSGANSTHKQAEEKCRSEFMQPIPLPIPGELALHLMLFEKCQTVLF